MSISTGWSEDRARPLAGHGDISEVLFGLFMVLTFTGTLSVATAAAKT